MPTVKTILGDQWMVNRVVSANFHLATFDDNGVELMRSKPHTVTLMPDIDDFVLNTDAGQLTGHAAMLAAQNYNITTRADMGWPPIEQADWDRLVGHCAVEHTPEIKAEYETYKVAQAEAALQTIGKRS